jgi:hypothetical protein
MLLKDNLLITLLAREILRWRWTSEWMRKTLIVDLDKTADFNCSIIATREEQTVMSETCRGVL